MRRLLMFAFALTLAAPALADPTPPGVNLRWDNCYSDGGVINKTFACDRNTGAETLVMSFLLDEDMLDASGMESRLFLIPASPTMPSWWSMKNIGTCRPSSLSLGTTLPLGSLNCADWASGNAAGGIGSYSAGSLILGPVSMVLQVAAAVPLYGIASLAANQEYFCGSLTINHAKTVGTGACGGCEVPVCIVFDRLRITTLASGLQMLNGANGPDSQFARWQNGEESNVALNYSGQNFGYYHSYNCQLSSTPTRNSTWGAVKALYR
ncbi:MAG TPA: hypothetical protein VN896_10475 [Methylomirabilota bacterium]|nr:hypothetical protein [Methylomirabilota bacterium]